MGRYKACWKSEPTLSSGGLRACSSRNLDSLHCVRLIWGNLGRKRYVKTIIYHHWPVGCLLVCNSITQDQKLGGAEAPLSTYLLIVWHLYYSILVVLCLSISGYMRTPGFDSHILWLLAASGGHYYYSMLFHLRP